MPAAGEGTRLLPCRYPKELLPVCFLDDGSGQLRPTVAAEWSLTVMHEGGITECLVVIADWKTEIVRYLGDGSEIGMNLAYLHRAVPRGLADAVDAAYPWVGDRHVCLALPDTVFQPLDAVARVRGMLIESGADLALGVFPTDQPHDLGPVRVADSGRVVEVLEKPARTDLYNTWGLALWSPRFTQLLHESLQEAPDLVGASIGLVFQRAVLEGLDVRALVFAQGSYVDIGRADSLTSLVAQTQRKIS